MNINTMRKTVRSKRHKRNFSLTFLFIILIRKSHHQNQHIAKSWKNPVFKYVLIKKTTTKTKNITKSRKNQILNYFLIRALNLKKQALKPRYCQKLWKQIFLLPFKQIFWKEKATTETKILPKAGKTIFQLISKYNFISKKKQSPKPRYYQKLHKSLFQ